MLIIYRTGNYWWAFRLYRFHSTSSVRYMGSDDFLCSQCTRPSIKMNSFNWLILSFIFLWFSLNWPDFFQFFIFRMIADYGALPCSIVTTTRKFFTVMASVLYFGNQLSNRQWIGAILVFVGLYQSIKLSYEFFWNCILIFYCNFNRTNDGFRIRQKASASSKSEKVVTGRHLGHKRFKSLLSSIMFIINWKSADNQRNTQFDWIRMMGHETRTFFN